jgi:heat shock protein HtpX
MASNWRRHAWTNRLQTLLLILALLGISALAAGLLFGRDGLWLALIASLVALLVEPAAAGRLTLRLYRARPIHPAEAPALWHALAVLAERAELPAMPMLHYVPSPVINAFTVGSMRSSAIAVTDGLLRHLSQRELNGVLAHEVAHIAHGDLRVMGLADSISRLTHAFSLIGQLFLFVSLPWLLLAEVQVNWPALLLLVLSPHLALLAQLGLSRVREFDADLKAAALTGDPEGLARALAHIEQASRSWQSILLPGWGNPEPSWLRTHPATGERIRRLLELRSHSPLLPTPEPSSSPVALVALGAPIAGSPRWRLGGLWR